MLLTDSDIVCLADLTQIDSEVPSVAQTAKPPIIVDGPGSICSQTWRECGHKISTAQQLYTSTIVAVGVSGGHQAAVNYIGSQTRQQPRTRLNQIVAHETQYAVSKSGLQLWMAYKALTLFYRDASARLKQDRLEVKYDRYKKDADCEWRTLRQLGLPWVAQPMEAPGALHGANAGSWTAANLSPASGSGTAQPLMVAITYYDASRYISETNTNNAESGPSAILPIAMPADTVLQVSIAGLNPPNGLMDQVGLADGPWTPLNASHWNLWVGQPGGPLYLQATTPIATLVCTLPANPVFSGSILRNGQWEDAKVTFQNLIGRG